MPERDIAGSKPAPAVEASPPTEPGVQDSGCRLVQQPGAPVRPDLGPEEQATWPGLTVESLLYAALIAAAAFIRLYDLGRYPLLTEEATQALAAWRFLHGQGASSGSTPFVFAGALLGFFAFGGSDAAARLVPALLGTALVFVPLALRRRLGTWGTLAATFLLAFSPTMVFYSRTLAGPMPALAGLGAVLVAVDLAAREQLRWARLAGAAGLAVAMTSSPWVYTFLLAGLLFLGLGWAAKRRGAAWGRWVAGGQAVRRMVGDRLLWVGLAAVALPLSTALLMNPGGLQGTADLLGAWLGRLVPGGSGGAWAYPLTILAFYEIVGLILGIAGLALGLRRGNAWAAFLGLWAVLGFLQATISGARDPAPVALAVLPLALLGGMAVEEAVSRLERAQWVWVGVCIAVLSVLVGFWWLQMAAFTNPDPEVARYIDTRVVGLLVALTPAVIVAAVLVFWYWIGRSETTRALAVFGLGLAGCLVLRSSVALNFSAARDAHEPMLSAPSSPDLRDLVAFLQDYSSRRVGDQHELSIVADSALEPLVPWYLKDFTALKLTPAPDAGAEAGALLLTTQPDRAGPKGYVRTRYYLRMASDVPFDDLRQALGWWLTRSGGGQVQAETCELWARP